MKTKQIQYDVTVGDQLYYVTANAKSSFTDAPEQAEYAYAEITDVWEVGNNGVERPLVLKDLDKLLIDELEGAGADEAERALGMEE